MDTKVLTVIMVAAFAVFMIATPASAQFQFTFVAPDTDDDGAPDYLDEESDSDQLLDESEWFTEEKAQALGLFGRGFTLDELNDIDGDGTPNFRDTDSDNDGITDDVETAAGWNPYDPTSPGNGGEGEGEGEGGSEGEGEGDPDGELPTHTADQDGDGAIALDELLRVIQIYNSSGYHCAVGEVTEDGFAPGIDFTKISCDPHMSDYDPQDWEVTLDELLRLIQIYNMGGYYPCVDGEDGFCAGVQ